MFKPLVIGILAFTTGSIASAQAGSKPTPSATAGVPAPMLYDNGDPITLGYACDATRIGVPYYNMTSGVARPIWICNGTNWLQATSAITATTATVGGSLIALGGSISTTVNVTSPDGSICDATPADGSLPSTSLRVDCAVKSGVATLRLSAPFLAVTPASTAWNLRIIQ
jgi:hypothetical protein